jgi:hypothetical protein
MLLDRPLARAPIFLFLLAGIEVAGFLVSPVGVFTLLRL